jgi:hypothetical protein
MSSYPSILQRRNPGGLIVGAAATCTSIEHTVTRLANTEWLHPISRYRNEAPTIGTPITMFTPSRRFTRLPQFSISSYLIVIDITGNIE